MASNTSLHNALLRQSEKYKNAWQRLPESLELPEPLSVNSVLRTFKGNTEKQKERFSTPQEAIRAAIEYGAGVVLVEAGPGQGKTSALLWSAHLDCKELLAETTDITGRHLPWYKNLGRLTKTGDAQKALEGIQYERPEVMRDKQGLFFMDGLDLLTGNQPDADAIVEAAIRSSEDEGHLYVFSGRPLDPVKGVLDDEEESYRIELAGLDSEAVDQWLEKHPQIQSAVDQICNANPSARSLRDTPLLFAMMVSAANATSGGQEPIDCNQYPGRAGLFHGFISHLRKRARIQKNLTGKQQAYSNPVLESLCWAALTAGHMEEIPNKNLEALLDCALMIAKDSILPTTMKDAEEDLGTSVEVFRKAGIVFKPENDDSIRFIHQEFMEYLGGKHLARRLNVATEGGWLEAELWDHLDSQFPLDNLLAHGLAQMQDDYRPKTLDLVFSLLEAYEFCERVAPLIPVDPGTASSLAFDFLKSEKPEERGSAVWALARIWAPEATESLIRALNDREKEVRWAAANVLGLIRAPTAVEPLIRALRDKENEVRWAAAEALGEIKDPNASDPLIKALQDKNKLLRRDAANALVRINGPKVWNFLTTAKRDEDKAVRRGAVEVLRIIKDSDAVDFLIEALQDPDDGVREAAVEALKEIKDPKAVQALIEALSDKHFLVSLGAADALGEIEAPEAVEPLIKLVQSKDRVLCWSAANALGKCKDSRVVDFLIEAMRDGDKSMRRVAAESLGESHDPNALDSLIEALKDSDEKVRLAAADALGKIKDSKAVDPLISALEDQDEDMRRAAAEALGKIRDSKAVGPLIKVLECQDHFVGQSAAWALGEIKNPAAVDHLITAMQKQDHEVRKAAAKALGEIKDSKAVESLLKALQDPGVNVRRAAGEALVKIWSNKSIGDPMSELRANAEKIPDEYKVRIANEWGRRWTSVEKLEKVDKQRNIRNKMEDPNYSEAMESTQDLLAFLRQYFENKEPFNSDDATREEVLAKLDELIEAVRAGAKPEAVKSTWNLLQNTVNALTLAEQVFKICEVLAKRFLV